MPGPKLDINTGNIIFGDDNMGFDSNGHMMMGMGQGMMVDMETGDIHFTIGESFDDDIGYPDRFEED